jgi:hypothetical protein
MITGEAGDAKMLFRLVAERNSPSVVFAMTGCGEAFHSLANPGDRIAAGHQASSCHYGPDALEGIQCDFCPKPLRSQCLGGLFGTVRHRKVKEMLHRL